MRCEGAAGGRDESAAAEPAGAAPAVGSDNSVRTWVTIPKLQHFLVSPGVLALQFFLLLFSVFSVAGCR